MSAARRIVAGGLRRHRIVVEAPAEIPDALGGARPGWAVLATLWARIEATGGREPVEAGRAEGRTETRITLRHRPGIDPRMRFRLGARIFLIRAVFDPDGRRRDLVCLCEETTP
ncbi:phage head closure protein [Rhabdaerophilum calidifontis]|uniref:phage head closure protein n=1 Tax=Rhabdaerophilum calidifontis TaxID=2604328 RepID=UPI00123C789F|nr:phage head closure protein [Rhabdaerophilum calidifontis]